LIFPVSATVGRVVCCAIVTPMKKKVIIFGTFDTVHKGHEYFVEEASGYGDLTIVVARDVNVKKFKEVLRNDENARLALVLESFPEMECRLGDPDDPHKIIELIEPDIICLGYDQASFDAGLAEKFPDTKIVRLTAFKPERYKTSKILP
jgi:cytidyltransferase-like protein